MLKSIQDIEKSIMKIMNIITMRLKNVIAKNPTIIMEKSVIVEKIIIMNTIMEKGVIVKNINMIIWKNVIAKKNIIIHITIIAIKLPIQNTLSTSSSETRITSCRIVPNTNMPSMTKTPVKKRSF